MANDRPNPAPLDSATLSIVVGPVHAKSVRVHHEMVEYRSVDNYTGQDSLTYRVCDTTGACATATLTITVT